MYFTTLNLAFRYNELKIMFSTSRGISLHILYPKHMQTGIFRSIFICISLLWDLSVYMEKGDAWKTLLTFI